MRSKQTSLGLDANRHVSCPRLKLTFAGARFAVIDGGKTASLLVSAKRRDTAGLAQLRALARFALIDGGKTASLLVSAKRRDTAGLAQLRALARFALIDGG